MQEMPNEMPQKCRIICICHKKYTLAAKFPQNVTNRGKSRKIFAYVKKKQYLCSVK